MTKPKAKTPAAEPAAPKAASEVGDRMSFTIERHVTKPQWRMKQRSTVKGVAFEKATEWQSFPDFSPELALAQGRMKSFIFGDLLGGRMPVANRRA